MLFFFPYEKAPDGIHQERWVKIIRAGNGIS
jgi:hypothetical protein